MAEYYFTQSLDLQDNIEPTAVITGDDNYNKFLYYQLKMSLRQAQSIDIIVSFLMESGVNLLLADLKSALERGVKIRLLTGSYLGITQPSALYLIKKELGDKIDLRFYNEPKRSFHPKAYIFHYENSGEIFIGSSNLSKSALTQGIEWNYRLLSSVDEENFNAFQKTFDNLFDKHSIIVDDKILKTYAKQWKRPAIAKDLLKYSQSDKEKVIPIIHPRGVQIEALYALENTRAEGAVKGLVQAATGIGKTYLAAFDSKNFQRILFVAHREEILKQAAVAFRNVRENDDYGFFMGSEKAHDKSVIFASVASLGKDEYLNKEYFFPNYFDYIVIDEFHHAVNEQYTKILNYFKPQFLLGLTATPDRLDGRNIFALCDYNVPYELSLQEAINKGILVPFRYYGIYDATDYSKLHLRGGHYTEKELNKIYLDNEKRAELIYKHYRKHHAKRTLAFCCSRKHAEFMTEIFRKNGVNAVAVYSNAQSEYTMTRQEALSSLIKGTIQVIFSVDMFNEGVDIPNVDMVMFLRPTESPIVFLQQLGRGLRQEKNKEYLTVLDFIGNYHNAGKVPYLLSGKIKENNNHQNNEDFVYPDECIVDFEISVIDLFEKMNNNQKAVKEIIFQEFKKVQELLHGKVPTRLELFEYMDADVYELCLKHSQDNLFKNFLEYKKQKNLLNKSEVNLYNDLGREFLHLLETTSMSKVYKMPVLNAFYNHGNIRMAVTGNDLLVSWKEFFNNGNNWRDLKPLGKHVDYLRISDQQHLSNIMKNPVNFLKKSGKGFFVEKDGFALALNEKLLKIIEEVAFKEHLHDIIAYRTIDYYYRRYKEQKDK